MELSPWQWSKKERSSLWLSGVWARSISYHVISPLPFFILERFLLLSLSLSLFCFFIIDCVPPSSLWFVAELPCFFSFVAESFPFSFGFRIFFAPSTQIRSVANNAREEIESSCEYKSIPLPLFFLGMLHFQWSTLISHYIIRVRAPFRGTKKVRGKAMESDGKKKKTHKTNDKAYHIMQ